MAVTGGLSAFLNHDIVLLRVYAMIVGTALIRKQINPVPFLIALAISSNIGAAATLIGNPQNMMIGEVAQLSFGKYMLWSFVPVLFAMAAGYAIIWFMCRNHLQSTVQAKPQADCKTEFNRVHTIKGLVILAVVVGLFFSSLPKEIIAMAAAGIHLASPKFRTEDLLALVDWPILVLFTALFVVTGAFQDCSSYGDQEWCTGWRTLAGSTWMLRSQSVMAVATAALSNLINNSAAVMLLLKVVNLSHATTPYILALANSFGGSLFIIGSVANIIVVQQARDMGVEDFVPRFCQVRSSSDAGGARGADRVGSDNAVNSRKLLCPL